MSDSIHIYMQVRDWPYTWNSGNETVWLWYYNISKLTLQRQSPYFYELLLSPQCKIFAACTCTVYTQNNVDPATPKFALKTRLTYIIKKRFAPIQWTVRWCLDLDPFLNLYCNNSSSLRHLKEMLNSENGARRREQTDAGPPTYVNQRIIN